MAERIINGTTYRVKAPLASVSITMMMEAGKIVGPGLDRLLGTYAASVGGAGDEATPFMASAVIEILKSVQDPAKVTDFLARFVRLAEIKRSDFDKVDLDELDQGDLIPLLGFVAEEAWGGFFSGLGESRSA